MIAGVSTMLLSMLTLEVSYTSKKDKGKWIHLYPTKKSGF